MLFDFLKRQKPGFIAQSMGDLLFARHRGKIDRRQQLDRRSHTRPNVSGLSRRTSIIDRRKGLTSR